MFQLIIVIPLKSNENSHITFCLICLQDVPATLMTLVGFYVTWQTDIASTEVYFSVDVFCYSISQSYGHLVS